MIFGLIGVGCGIWRLFARIFVFVGYDNGFFVGLLLYVLLVGQYLWRHRQSLSGSAMTTGIVVGSFFIFLLTVWKPFWF